MNVSLILLGLSTGLSTVSVVLAVYALRSVNAKEPKRRVSMLETQLADLEYIIASHTSTIKRLNARVGMREARAKQQEPDAAEASNSTLAPLPGESTAAWKARVRPLLSVVRKSDG